MQLSNQHKFFRYFIAANYHVAALLLFVAGISKLIHPIVGDILNALVDTEVLTLNEMVLIYRIQPWFEAGLGLFALIGWQAQWSARIIAVLFLFFSGLIYYVVDGYLTMPVACGCFGEAEGNPAYLDFIRNVVIAFFLFFFTASYRNLTLYNIITKHLRKD